MASLHHFLRDPSLPCYSRTKEGKLIDCNDAFAFLLGFSSRIEMLDLNYEVNWNACSSRRSCISEDPSEWILEKKDGSLLWVQTFCRRPNWRTRWS